MATLMLLAAAAVALGATGVAGTAGVGGTTGAVGVVDDADDDADGPAFETAFTSVEPNGTTEVEMTADEPFTLLIGDEDDMGYELRATVTPDEDGNATVAFDHADAGVDGETLAATGADEVTVTDETDLDTTLDAGDYEMAVFAGTDGDHDADDAYDLGVLAVEPIDDEDGDTETPTATPDPDPTPVPEEHADEADLVLDPAGEQGVAVPVDLDDGETLALRVRSASGVSPGFIETADAVVEDGEAVATFDFDDGALEAASHGDEATVHPRGHDDAELERYDILFVDDDVGVTAADDAPTDTPGDAGEETDGGETDSEETDGEDTPNEADGTRNDDGASDLDEEAPGFGTVVALAGLLAAALVAVAGRRR